MCGSAAPDKHSLIPCPRPAKQSSLRPHLPVKRQAHVQQQQSAQGSQLPGLFCILAWRPCIHASWITTASLLHE